MEKELLRKVQLTLLEIAKEIKRVCEENDIRYFLYRGTFLGAVRHQGFIPWDDDMDFAMLREDYDKFCRIALEKLGKDFVFQNWHTDEKYALPFGKVRKRGTVYVESKCAVLEENGLYIDIYPLDFAPESPEKREALAQKLLHTFRVKLMKSRYTPWKEEEKTVLYKRVGYIAYQALALFTTHRKLIEGYEAAFREAGESDTLYEQSALPVTYYFDRAHYMESAMYPFEDTCFPGPKDFDGVLSSLYGDYMQLPPEDQRENRHQIKEISFGDEEA